MITCEQSCPILRMSRIRQRRLKNICISSLFIIFVPRLHLCIADCIPLKSSENGKPYQEIDCIRRLAIFFAHNAIHHFVCAAIRKRYPRQLEQLLYVIYMCVWVDIFHNMVDVSRIQLSEWFCCFVYNYCLDTTSARNHGSILTVDYLNQTHNRIMYEAMYQYFCSFCCRLAGRYRLATAELNTKLYRNNSQITKPSQLYGTRVNWRFVRGHNILIKN